ncbi:hypothetical protein RKD20_007964 [Streptomyces sp. SLBN-8D4]|jgi:hypothetical protein
MRTFAGGPVLTLLALLLLRCRGAALSTQINSSG